MWDQLRKEEIPFTMAMVFDEAFQDSRPTSVPSELAHMASEGATKLKAKPRWRLLYKLCHNKIGMTVLA